ncbi:MAG: hypothetical protein HYV07_25575 [Deltaproteobacteria bacterium]|nr:hypothetical protein [Deltaproteobacteria bacterium]
MIPKRRGHVALLALTSACFDPRIAPSADGAVAVVASVDERGLVRRVGLDPTGISLAPDERLVTFALGLDQLFDENGRPVDAAELSARSALEDPPTGSCDACRVRTLLSPQTLFPADACPVPRFASSFIDAEPANPNDVLVVAVREQVRIDRAGTCPEDTRGRPIQRTLAPIWPPGPLEDVMQPQAVAHLGDGTVAAFGENVAVLVRPDGSRRVSKPPLYGPIHAAIGVGDGFLVASADHRTRGGSRFDLFDRDLDAQPLNLTGLIASKNLRVFGLALDQGSPARIVVSGQSGSGTGVGPYLGTCAFAAQLECDDVFSSQALGALVSTELGPKRLTSPIHLESGPYFAVGRDGYLVAGPFGSEGRIELRDLGQPRRPREARSVGFAAGRVYLCVREDTLPGEADREPYVVFTATIGASGLGAPRSIARFVQPCGPMAPREDGSVDLFMNLGCTPNGDAPCAERVVLHEESADPPAPTTLPRGLRPPLSWFSSFPGGYLALTTSSQLVRASTTAEVIIGARAARAGALAAVASNGPSSFAFPAPLDSVLEVRPDLSVTETPIPLEAAFPTGAVFDHVRGDVVVVGARGDTGWVGRYDPATHALVNLDAARTPHRLLDVAEVAPGIAIGVGDAWTIVRIQGDQVEALELDFDDPSTQLVERAESGFSWCQTKPHYQDPVPPESFFAIDALDGVAIVAGCHAMVFQVPAFGAPTRLAMPPGLPFPDSSVEDHSPAPFSGVRIHSRHRATLACRDTRPVAFDVPFTVEAVWLRGSSSPLIREVLDLSRGDFALQVQGLRVVDLGGSSLRDLFFGMSHDCPLCASLSPAFENARILRLPAPLHSLTTMPNGSLLATTEGRRIYALVPSDD